MEHINHKKNEDKHITDVDRTYDYGRTILQIKIAIFQAIKLISIQQ